jgi:hypothetical protein
LYIRNRLCRFVEIWQTSLQKNKAKVRKILGKTKPEEMKKMKEFGKKEILL